MDNNRQGAKASIIALIVFIGLWIALPSTIRRLNKEAFSEFQAPAIQLLSKSRDLARYWELRSRSTEDLIAAGRDLARINATLELKLHAMEDIRKENLRLREMLRYPNSTEYLTVVARVATRDTSTWWQRMLIRKGRNDGIRPGCPVVFGNRVVGRVTTVHLNISEVELVTSPAFRCTAFLEGDDPPRIVHVSGVASNPFTTGRAKVSIIQPDYTPPAGQVAKVITTGLGGVFPAGLILGTLEGGVTQTAQGNLKEAYMVPSKNLDTIEEVSVLVPKYPTAGEILMSPTDRIKLEEFK
jgi:rod shape-determining protein MreC